MTDYVGYGERAALLERVAVRRGRAAAGPVSGHGRYVGRVGALAVALGIGAAVAAMPAVASADTTRSSGSSEAADAPSSSSGSTGSPRSARPGTARSATRSATQPGRAPAGQASESAAGVDSVGADGDATEPLGRRGLSGSVRDSASVGADGPGAGGSAPPAAAVAAAVPAAAQAESTPADDNTSAAIPAEGLGAPEVPAGAVAAEDSAVQIAAPVSEPVIIAAVPGSAPGQDEGVPASQPVFTAAPDPTDAPAEAVDGLGATLLSVTESDAQAFGTGTDGPAATPLAWAGVAMTRRELDLAVGQPQNDAPPVITAIAAEMLYAVSEVKNVLNTLVTAVEKIENRLDAAYPQPAYIGVRIDVIYNYLENIKTELEQRRDEWNVTQESDELLVNTPYGSFTLEATSDGYGGSVDTPYWSATLSVTSGNVTYSGSSTLPWGHTERTITATYETDGSSYPVQTINSDVTVTPTSGGEVSYAVSWTRGNLPTLTYSTMAPSASAQAEGTYLTALQTQIAAIRAQLLSKYPEQLEFTGPVAGTTIYWQPGSGVVDFDSSSWGSQAVWEVGSGTVDFYYDGESLGEWTRGQRLVTLKEQAQKLVEILGVLNQDPAWTPGTIQTWFQDWAPGSVVKAGIKDIVKAIEKIVPQYLVFLDFILHTSLAPHVCVGGPEPCYYLY